MPVSDQEFSALKRRVAVLEMLVRQLQGALPPLGAVASQEVPDGS
jgi:hypothetical protein